MMVFLNLFNNIIMQRPRLTGAIKVCSSDKHRKTEPQVYTGNKVVIIGSKQEFYQLIAY